MSGIFDNRNKLNDLTGREWLKLTKSFMLSEKCADDRDAFAHPAPFLIKDVEKMISFFTKKGMLVLDPFVGCGTTIISAYNLGRKCIGMDLNRKFYHLALKRFKKKGIVAKKDYEFIIGDAAIEVPKLKKVDYIITSPPYHNILRNKTNGLRKDNTSKGYRSGSRIGLEYYTDMPNDLGNQESYPQFLLLLENIMRHCHEKLNSRKYCSLIISDFTVKKKEVCVQTDIVNLMQNIGFEFVGTIVLLQNNKPLYPFGYPFAFRINHMHQNIINFRKRS